MKQKSALNSAAGRITSPIKTMKKFPPKVAQAGSGGPQAASGGLRRAQAAFRRVQAGSGGLRRPSGGLRRPSGGLRRPQNTFSFLDFFVPRTFSFSGTWEHVQ